MDSLKDKFKEKTVKKETNTNETTEKVAKNENNIKNV